MAGKDLKVALKITADLNQARREMRGIKDELVDTSKAADNATKSQQSVSKASSSTADAIKKMSTATDMKDGTKQLNVYDQQLNKVTGSSAQFAESNNKVLQSLKGFAPQLLSISAASAGFMAIAMDTVNKAAELKNQSALGGLNVEEFQYYAAGAKTVGIQTEKLGDIFKDTRDKVGDFLATGGGELKDFFEKIAPKVGVTAEQFKKLNGAESLQLIFDSLKKTGMSDNEIVFYLESVADEATALVPLLEKSGEGFKKFGDKAKASGAILSKDMVNDAIAAKNAIGDVQNQVMGLTNKMVANAAPAITFLAQNLDVLAQAGIIAASVYVARLAPSIIASTKATIADLTTKGQAIFLSKSRATALLAEANASQIKAAAELKSAQTAAAVAMGTSAQTAAQARLTTARTADTAATLAQSRAQEVYNTTMSRSRLSAGVLMGALGGPVGLAITAAGVAASFLLMKDSSAQVAPVLDIQGQSVDELRAKYEQLGAIQKDTALHEIKKQVEETSLKFKVASSDLSAFIEALPISDEKINTYRKLNTQFIQGKITADNYYNALKNGNVLNEEQLRTAGKLISAYSDTKKEFKTTKEAQEALTSTSKTASSTNNDLNKSITETGNAAIFAAGQIGGLTKAHKELLETAQNNTLSNWYQIDLMKKGVSPEKAAKDAKSLDTLNADPNSTQTYFRLPDDLSNANALDLKVEKERLALEQKITQDFEKRKKIAEQTNKINKTVLAQSIKYNYAEKEKNAGLPNGLLYAISTRESGGDRFAKSPVGAKGAFQFMPKTAERFKLSDRTDVNRSAEAATEYLKWLWERYNGDLDKTIMAYNAGEGNVDSGKAYSFKETQKYLAEVKKNLAAINGFKDENAQNNLSKMLSAEDDTRKKIEQLKQERVTIDLRFATEPEKLKKEYDDLVKDINKAGYDPDTLKIRLVQAEKEYQDKLSKRPEILKRVQESMTELDKSWLKASGNDLESSLMEIDEKWKQPKADLASLMMSEPNALQANKYQEMLVKIDFVIDQEKLTLQYNNAIDRFKELDELRNSRLDNLKTQYDSGQITQPQYAEQAKEINEQLRPEMENLIQLAWQYADAMQGVSGERARENTLAMQQSLIETNNEFRKFLPTAEQLNEQIAGGLTDSIMAWADGVKSVEGAFKQFAASFLREIAQMILKQMLFNAVSQMTGAASAAAGSGGAGGMIAGVLSSAFGGQGFMDGGHTGYGPRDAVAGVVHKDEWVTTKRRTSEPGAKQFLAYFEKYGMQGLNKFKGYADGGLVGAPQVNVPNIPTPKVADPAAMIANSTSFSANQNFYLVDDPARILDILKSGASQENLVVMMSRDPAKFKSALQIGG
ncbi:transglycosylase SLT domain-containing protein [Acinetobacter nematophilus]|uniref:Transglycosylase SLT domain-containing protein n=1 Tax=Acinetobacter nematophilus TaxID=2994642 RepID=A0A9X3IFU9_9GAMM|nr:transglycosylase SLT domain-containing protein [Acinetobacter nematophilus]MCX5466491.1 transglycosylase SLT domain-containing protein [Acinetobacter nematophilus]